MKRLKKLSVFTLKFLVSVILLRLIFKRIDISVFMDSFREARLSHLAVCAVILVCGGFAGAASWYNVIRAGSLNVKYTRVAAMHWCGMFFNSFLPSNIGGDFFKGWMLVKDQGRGVSPVAASIIVDRVINLSLLILIGLASFAFFHGECKVLGALVVSAVMVFAILDFTARRWKVKEGHGRFILFIQSLFDLFRSTRHCAATFCAAAVSQACKIGCHLFILSALGLKMDPDSIWYVIPVFGVVSALPVSLNGLGVRESVALLIAKQAGTTGEELVALSLFSHLLFVTVNSLGLIPFLMHRKEAGNQ